LPDAWGAMLRRFPRRHVFLERTRLRYVRFANLLNDGKHDRAARVPGFVVVFLGDEVELIFLLGGEPANAARLGPAGRCVVPIGAVVARAAAESEHGEVAFYGAPEAQLRAMFATVAAEPLTGLPPLDFVRPGRTFRALEAAGFEGVLELRDGDAVHYLTFEAGRPAEGFFVEEAAGTPLPARLEALLAGPRAASLEAVAYPPVASLPVQAPAALVELYARVLDEAAAALAERLGAEGAARCLKEALERASARHPTLASYCVGPDGRVAGAPVADAAALTAAVAGWLFEALTAAGRSGAVDPARVLERVARERRFALESQGFFRRLPWPVG